MRTKTLPVRFLFVAAVLGLLALLNQLGSGNTNTVIAMPLSDRTDLIGTGTDLIGTGSLRILADAATTSSASPPLDYVLTLVYSFATFLALAIVCDEYLCPAIDIICELKQIPDDLAGATLLAFGSSAPEIFMNLAATAKGQVTLSLPAIFGSSIIAFGFIPPLCAFSVAKPMRLVTWPVIRDSGMYCISLAVLWNALSDGYIDRPESTHLTLLYFVYLAVLLVPFAIRAWRGENRRSSAKEDLYNDIEAEPLNESEDSPEEGGVVAKFMDVASIPFQKVFSLTIPVQPESASSPSLGTAFFSVFVSLIWVTALSAIALSVAQFAATTFDMSQTTAGATLLALGAQIPDTFGSLSLAKSGMPAGAVANAVGSQVINVTLAVGAPFLAYNMLFDKPIFAGKESNAMRQLAELLMVVIGVFWCVVFPVAGWATGTVRVERSRLDKAGGGVLFATAMVCYTIFVYKQENS